MIRKEEKEEPFSFVVDRVSHLRGAPIKYQGTLSDQIKPEAADMPGAKDLYTSETLQDGETQPFRTMSKYAVGDTASQPAADSFLSKMGLALTALQFVQSFWAGPKPQPKGLKSK